MSRMVMMVVNTVQKACSCWQDPQHDSCRSGIATSSALEMFFTSRKITRILQSLCRFPISVPPSVQFVSLRGWLEKSAKNLLELIHHITAIQRPILVDVDHSLSSRMVPALIMEAQMRVVVFGVYFGPGSKLNTAKRLASPGPGTNQKAELSAVILAMQVVGSKILPERRTMVNDAKGGDGLRDVADVMGVRLVVVTDSSYTVEGMCNHFSGWKENTQGVLVTKAGKVVGNSEGFLTLKAEVEKLSKVGVQVFYYLVGREENTEADILAKAGAL